jgi:AsmA protein
MRIAHAKINGMKIFEELSKATKRQEVNDPHLRDFVLRSEVRDNKIIIKPFSIKVSGFDADIEGTSEMTGAIQYIVKLQLLPFGIKIPFHVSGNYDNPKVTIGKGHVLPPPDSIKSK